MASRGGLLKQIQKGKKLKKATTVDKSGPVLSKTSGGGSGMAPPSRGCRGCLSACACSLSLSLSALVLMRAQCVCSRKRPTSRLYTLKSLRPQSKNFNSGVMRDHAGFVAFSPCTAVSYEVLTRWISQLGVLEVTGSKPDFVNTHDLSTHMIGQRVITS